MSSDTTAIRVLLVDDDAEFVALLAEYLGNSGAVVSFRHSGGDALNVDESSYDVMVLDVMMPGMSGIDVLRTLRERSDVPVIMLTAMGDDVDRIVGLEIGADDYLAKPCNPRELLARIRAVLRRSGPQAASTKELINGNVTLRPASRWVAVDDADPELTSTEYSMLEVLMRNEGRVVTKSTLSESVLGRPLGKFDRTVDMHVSNLRRKLMSAGARKGLIETVRGAGYQLTAP